MRAGGDANADTGFEGFTGVPDLNSGWVICDACGFGKPGVTHERGQDAVCASDGVCAVEDVWAHHRAAQGRCRRAHIELRRSVSRHGLRATHLARVAARYRGVPGSQSSQAVSHGSEDSAGAIDAGRCAEPARLAHLPCTGSAADRACQGSRSIFGAFASKTRSRARRWCS